MSENDLDLLITHVQKEVDYLSSELDQSIKEADFIYAAELQSAIEYTYKKLNSLQQRKNPHHYRMLQLEAQLNKKDRGISSDDIPIDQNAQPEEKNILLLHLKKSRSQWMSKIKAEYEELQSLPAKAVIDDDTILSLLDKLADGSLSKLEFEIIEESVYLDISMVNQCLVLKLVATRKPLNYYTPPNATHIFSLLGFDPFTLKMTIPNFQQSSKSRILEVLSIIIFDVFEREFYDTAEQQTMNIKVETYGEL